MTFPRLLMTLSAAMLALLGLPCVFAPDVLLARLAGSTAPVTETLVQLTGALYLGFAALNWMSKGSLLGGIYGRPLAMGNLLHFVAGSFTLFRVAPTMGALAWTLAIAYGVFAAGFARVIFRDPLPTAPS